MKFLIKWFETFSWIAGINCIYALISDNFSFSKLLIIAIMIISAVFALIPEAAWTKLKIQLERDM